MMWDDVRIFRIYVGITTDTGEKWSAHASYRKIGTAEPYCDLYHEIASSPVKALAALVLRMEREGIPEAP